MSHLLDRLCKSAERIRNAQQLPEDEILRESMFMEKFLGSVVGLLYEWDVEGTVDNNTLHTITEDGESDTFTFTVDVDTGLVTMTHSNSGDTIVVSPRPAAVVSMIVGGW